MRFLHPLFLLLWAASVVTYVLGVSLPMITTQRLFILHDDYSVLDVIATLYREDEIPLAGVIALFTIAIPIAKLTVLGLAVFADRPTGANRFLHAAHAFGKWSMIDVMLIALVIFAMKTSGVADALTNSGFYYFTASVALSLALSQALLLRKYR